ncbi:MAG: diaminopimelate epimerase, partial [Ignavibacteria bacterium]
FIKKIYDGFYKIRTYERGVEAETLACGSGSIASAMFIFLLNKDLPPVEFKTRGNKILKINFEFSNNSFKNISLIGPAEKVFEGFIDL